MVIVPPAGTVRPVGAVNSKVGADTTTEMSPFKVSVPEAYVTVTVAVPVVVLSDVMVMLQPVLAVLMRAEVSLTLEQVMAGPSLERLM